MFSLLVFIYSPRPIKQIKANKRSRAICRQIAVSHGMRINHSLNNSKLMKKCVSGTVLAGESEKQSRMQAELRRAQGDTRAPQSPVVNRAFAVIAEM